MAIMHQHDHQSSSHILFDALYCEEERWEDEEEATSEIYDNDDNSNSNSLSLFPVFLEQDLFWEEEELLSLFSKEEHQSATSFAAADGRGDAVQWILKVNARNSFTALTAVLAVNYLDRFFASLRSENDKNANKPWMVQLVAVTCLSLAAKVEETQVPLLLDLQVNERKYVFEAKMIQRMELLVLSTLQWRMHPVTSLSFLDFIVGRLGLKTSLHWEFLKRCETLLLSLISDSRFIGHFPSVMATATMMKVIEHVEPCNADEYKTQLLSVLKLSKEKVDKCYGLVSEISSSGIIGNYNNPHKRKFVPTSPSGVIDAVFGSDSSNESWAVGSSSSSSPLACSSPSKKSRTEDQKKQMRLACSVLVEAIGSPH